MNAVYQLKYLIFGYGIYELFYQIVRAYKEIHIKQHIINKLHSPSLFLQEHNISATIFHSRYQLLKTALISKTKKKQQY